MVDECRKSPVTAGFRAEHIPYGLDTQIFRFRPKTRIREIFRIPESDFVIGFVAETLNDPRKGMHLLLEALAGISGNHPNLHLLTVGSGNFETLPVPSTHAGPIGSGILLSHFYSACDLFVCPSTQDNLPNTVLEALACGTPVLGFSTGGVPDLVDSPEKGKLVELAGGSEALCNGLREWISLNWQVEINKRLPFAFSMEKQAKNYSKIYHSFPN
jgi:glycosyltransferase involved in cell wall biosynthesis